MKQYVVQLSFLKLGSKLTPMPRSPSRSRSRYQSGDLALRLEVLGDRVDELSASLASTQKEVASFKEWVPWLYLLFQCMHRVFRNSPEWPQAPQAPQDIEL